MQLNFILKHSAISFFFFTLLLNGFVSARLNTITMFEVTYIIPDFFFCFLPAGFFSTKTLFVFCLAFVLCCELFFVDQLSSFILSTFNRIITFNLEIFKSVNYLVIIRQRY